MTWGQGVCYASLHSEPISTLGLPPCQYGHSGGTRGWLGVERCQLCLQDTSRSAKWHRQAAVGHWVSLCVWSVVGWLIVYQDGNYLYPGLVDCRLDDMYRLWGRNILMARPSTFLESRSWWGHDFGKFNLFLGKAPNPMLPDWITVFQKHSVVLVWT